MNADDEKILRLSKEIIIKFIELGRISTGNFEENFKSIFWTIKSTVVDARLDAQTVGLHSSEGERTTRKTVITEEE